MTSPHDRSNLADVELLLRYVKGECTPAEHERMAAAVAVNPELAERVNALRGARWNTERRLKEMWETFAQQQERLTESPQPMGLPTASRHRGASTHTRSAWGWMGGTAVVALLGVGLYRAFPYLRPQSVAPEHRYTTLPGQRQVVRLSDGTRVVLAPQTSLVVLAGFGTRNRELTLSGQAYFDVSSSSSAPFLVRSGDAVTRVLGTDFMIRRYPEDSDIIVAVNSGKVMATRGTPVTLTRNMVAQLTDSNVVVRSGVDLREYIEWTEGRLVFSKVTATEVTKVLGNWYGLTFRFADSTLATHLITGAFDGRYSREEVLQNLQLILGVRMVFDHDVVTLISARSAHSAPARRIVPDEMRKIPTEVGQ